MTACDSGLEDLMPWWIQNTRRFTSAPVYVIDLGMTDVAIKMLQGQGARVGSLTPLENMHPWFNKPWCLEKTETDQTLWLDVDVEVLKPIDDIWDLCHEGKIGLCEDPVMQRQGPEHMYTLNSGVMLLDSVPKKFLKRWQKEIQTNKYRGDQEALRGMIQFDKMLRQETVELFKLPQEWNWLRLMYMRGEDSEDKKMLHWTGPSGKQIIRDKIAPRFFAQQGPTGNRTVGHYWSPEGVERKTDGPEYKRQQGIRDDES